MILGFKEYFDKQKTKPTYFREKILAGVGYIPSDVSKIPKNGQGVLHLIEHPKIHTIREGHRWKAGDLMHMAYGVRTKNYCQFNKGIPELERVNNTQDIEIKYYGTYMAPLPSMGIIGGYSRTIRIKIDGREHYVLDIKDPAIIDFADSGKIKMVGTEPAIKKFTVNDGFDSVSDFFLWFSKDFEGQIVQFTDFKY